MSGAGPFMRWAGGKGQSMPTIRSCMPEFGTYIEPFLGGGAVMFMVLSETGAKVMASDINEELIVTYSAVRDDPEGVVGRLEDHLSRYGRSGSAYYYAVREDGGLSGSDAAARMIFLNRTCYNGLYRVNAAGQFNVPHGRSVETGHAPLSGRIRASGRLLRDGGASLACNDFEVVCGAARRGDFVYLDPPYNMREKTVPFRYHGQGFGGPERKRLAEACASMHDRGCLVMLSGPAGDLGLDAKTWKTVPVITSARMSAKTGRRAGLSDSLTLNYRA